MIRRFAALVVWAPVAACAAGLGPPTAPPDTGRRVVAEHAAIASADPRASDAGLQILRAGGNAIDAAVAAAFVIGVVEPQMSGIGGGGAMTVWLRDQRRAEFLDFYASQNAATWNAAFEAGRMTDPPQPDLRDVGVPGNVAGLLDAHERYGRLTREQVMAPAIRLAEEGFPVSQTLAGFILENREKLSRFASSMRLMYPGGRALAPGQILRNTELAATLRRISQLGPAGFYDGEIAQSVVQVLNAGGNPATTADLAGFPIRWKRPLCSYYRGRVLLSAPPPQSGSQVLHTLELLERYDLPGLGLPTRSADAFHILASALRVGIADNRVIADPNWRHVPAAGIVSEGFAQSRSALVDEARVPATVAPGDATSYEEGPVPASCVAFEPWGPSPEVPVGAQPDAYIDDSAETTHISVVDEDGNAVSLTQTNSSVFGSGASVRGFFLNDSGIPLTHEAAAAPSLSPWITRRTTIAPTIVMYGRDVAMVAGAPGGGRIPTALIQVMIYTMDYGMDPLDAVRMPRMFPAPDSRSIQIETGFSAAVLEAASDRGWQPAALSPGYARLYLVVRRNDRWIAVADPRHSGEARGY